MSAGISSAQVTAAYTAAGNGMTAPAQTTGPDGSTIFTATSTSGAIQIVTTLFTEAELPGSGKAGVWRVNYLATPVAADITSIKAFAASLGYVIGPNTQFTGMGVPGANGTVVAFSQSF